MTKLSLATNEDFKCFLRELQRWFSGYTESARPTSSIITQQASTTDSRAGRIILQSGLKPQLLNRNARSIPTMSLHTQAIPTLPPQSSVGPVFQSIQRCLSHFQLCLAFKRSEVAQDPSEPIVGTQDSQARPRPIVRNFSIPIIMRQNVSRY